MSPPMTPTPAPFEHLRHYAEQAVEQLLREMADQAVRYAVPADDVLALLRRVATIQRDSPWEVWETWALRHALPVHDLIRRARRRDNPTFSDEERAILRARLRDLFGYALLGLVLTEEDSLDKS
jgi:hypothetical protein